MNVETPGIIAILLLSQCYSSSSNSYRNGGKEIGTAEVDMFEVARQNRITQQILQSFLEKKLLKRPRTQPPSVWDILPKVKKNPPPESENIQDLLNNNTESTPAETLQVVESEQISSVYDDIDDLNDIFYEGMLYFVYC